MRFAENCENAQKRKKQASNSELKKKWRLGGVYMGSEHERNV
jgi:hypothetical protein